MHNYNYGMSIFMYVDCIILRRIIGGEVLQHPYSLAPTTVWYSCGCERDYVELAPPHFW